MSAYISCSEITKHYHLQNTGKNEYYKNNILGNGRVQNKQFTALENVSFELIEGDRLGVIGMNGAGKSTLLKIISGILKPTSGKVEVSGSVTSVIEQSSLFIPDLTGIENIFMLGNLSGYDKLFIEKKLYSIIEYSGLGNYINEPVKNYSSGMVTRLSFALFNELSSDILILDEALSAGDNFFREQAEKSIHKFFGQSKIVIIASHQMQEVYSYCNKCLVLNNGKTEFIGSVDEAVSHYHSLNKLFDGYIYENENLKIEKITMNSADNIFRISDKIMIEMMIDISREENEIYPAVYISNHLGNILTDCPRYRKDFTAKKQEIGKYLFTVEIPSNLFNVGEYILTIIFGNINEVLLEMKNVIKFKIVTDEWELGENWNIPTYFPIRPQLKWEIDKV